MLTIMEELITRYPQLGVCRGEVEEACRVLIRCFSTGHKLLVCGNGGSCADAEHIVGELMKGFLKKRPLSGDIRDKMKKENPLLEDGLLDQLQCGLPAISLTGSPALSTAFANDVNPELIYAQQVIGLGESGDVLLGISTSGNAANVYAAAQVARGLQMEVIGLTGRDGGKLKSCSDICIVVPEKETFKIQELHLPVYHALCAAAEAHFFAE